MIDHYLQVELIVPQDRADAFERASDAFLVSGGFSGVTPNPEYRFELGLRTVEPFVYRPYGRFSRALSDVAFNAENQPNVFRDGRLIETELVHRYIHLWSVPNLIGLDLDAIMRACVDNNLYLDIDDQVVREVQNFVRLVHQPGFPAPIDPDPVNTQFVRVVRRLKGVDMAKYLFRWGAQLPVWAAQGWHALGQFQNITGLLNVVTEFWQTSEGNLPALRLPAERPRKAGDTPFPEGTGEAREHYALSVYFLNEVARRDAAAEQ